MSERDRLVCLDVLKASAIIAVLWIHAFSELGTPHEAINWRLNFLMRFAVPAFFFVSGFLTYKPRPIPFALLRRRCLRLLAPYVVASALAIAFWQVALGPLSVTEMIVLLLTGSAVFPFYFVPVLVGALLVGMLLSRLPALQIPLLLVLLVTGVLSETRVLVLPPFWEWRSPFRWWGYFLSGWTVAAQIGTISRLSLAVRRCIAGGVVVMLGAIVWYARGYGSEWRWTLAVLQYLSIYCCIAALFLLSFDWREHRAVRWLSEATYPIYLYHYSIMFLYTYFIAGRLEHRFGLSSVAIESGAFVVGGVGSLCVVYCGRRLFGRAARLVIG